MSSHTKLVVWQKSVDLVEFVYKITREFPDEEKFGLVSQMRRCAVSIPSNIAEGQGRKTNGEFGYFLRIAYGSSSELETQLLIASRLGFLTKENYDSVIVNLEDVRKMLNGLLTHVSKTSDDQIT